LLGNGSVNTFPRQILEAVILESTELAWLHDRIQYRENVADFLRTVNVATLFENLTARWARSSSVTARIRNCVPLMKPNFGRNWIFPVLPLHPLMISIILYSQCILVSFSRKLWSGCTCCIVALRLVCCANWLLCTTLSWRVLEESTDLSWLLFQNFGKVYNSSVGKTVKEIRYRP
jgi:hypothetical protein